MVPETIGGSADLTGSNLTNTTETLPFTATDRTGRYMRYGIREHEMASAMNGIALHKGLIPYGGTFLVFTDYARPAIRLSRDHGPARHLRDDARLDRPRRRRPDPPAGRASLDAARDPEPARAASRRCGRDARMLADRARDRRPRPRSSRSAARTCRRCAPTTCSENLCAKGAYIIAGDANADAVIFATGSEVAIAVESLKLLKPNGASRPRSSRCRRWSSSPSSPMPTRPTVIGKPKAQRRDRGRHRDELGQAARRQGPLRRHAQFRRQRARPKTLYEHFGITAKGRG